MNEEIILLSDSFAPIIDGVANVTLNYGRELHRAGQNVSVLTPNYPGADDSGFEFPVMRYPSIDLRKSIGYTAGNPFDVPTLKELNRHNIGILHSHCPVVSSMLARSIRESANAPYILTYHTKYDIDIGNAVKLKAVQAAAIKALVDNVSAADEVWTVSHGAGENLRSLGYEGDYIVMENGVDVPRQRCTEAEISEAVKGYDLPSGVPVFLFVGRLMWYKGLHMILDSLAALKSQNYDFRMVIIGGGGDEKAIREYAQTMNLGDKVIFTGPIRERRTIAAWYCFADLFLFPSTFDTNGLVVREAAACSLGSVLVRGSCAAEGVVHGHNGLLIDENAASLAVCLARFMDDRNALRRIGENASRELYLSWDEAVKRALERYEIVSDNYKSGKYRTRKSIYTLSSELVSLLTAAEEYAKGMLNRKERAT